LHVAPTFAIYEVSSESSRWRVGPTYQHKVNRDIYVVHVLFIFGPPHRAGIENRRRIIFASLSLNGLSEAELVVDLSKQLTCPLRDARMKLCINAHDDRPSEPESGESTDHRSFKNHKQQHSEFVVDRSIICSHERHFLLLRQRQAHRSYHLLIFIIKWPVA
jgi:hypothetical protein